MMIPWKSLKTLLPVAGLIWLAGCEEAAPERVERVRAIKPYFVIEPAGGDVRRYSGTVVASNTSALSFAVSGTVKTVAVNLGDRVTKGQVLATLDVESFSLNVQAAKAELAAAQAELDNARAELVRQRQLFDRGWVAKAALDRAISLAEAAEGQLDLLSSRLSLAQRDVANTRLLAPFDGVISAREVEPFAEISRGEKVLQVDSDGAFEVEISVPDSLVSRLAPGTPLVIDAPTSSACGCRGRITEIGATAGAANAVTVKGAILSGGGALLAGMAVDVGVTLAGERATEGYLVPLVSIAPGEGPARGFVFKFDAESGQVRRTAVKGVGVIDGNLVGVAGGIKPGDVIAAAGVSLLRDGQRVTLLGQ
ncbi:MAG: efflux RND transporter periplasmic adaptor subunit [Alphaproteobacteria bacterium]|jgi:RND family efflux transporter MFP subunit|nr:efflux RND transporter periplasmic adaptor subunit [Alphaproteobacteria bacterium]